LFDAVGAGGETWTLIGMEALAWHHSNHGRWHADRRQPAIVTAGTASDGAIELQVAVIAGAPSSRVSGH
jgi:hypothetical protein